MGKPLVSCIVDCWVPIMGIWLLAGAWSVMLVLDHLSLTESPDAWNNYAMKQINHMRKPFGGSNSSRIFEALHQSGFKAHDRMVPEMLVLTCDKCEDITKEQISKNLNQRLEQVQKNSDGTIYEQLNYFTYKWKGHQKNYISEDKRKTVFTFSLDRFGKVGTAYSEILNEADLFRKELQSSAPDFKLLGPTGAASVLLEGMKEQRASMYTHHAATLPLVLIVFFMLIPSWRLLAILGPCLMSAFAISMALIITGVKNGLFEFEFTFGTPMVLAFSLIFCTDFSLFLNRRMLEEASNNQTPMKSLEIAHQKVGPMILLSAALLSMGWGCLFCLPRTVMTPSISSMGLGGITAICMSAFHCLTLLPCFATCFGLEKSIPKLENCFGMGKTPWVRALGHLTDSPIRSGILLVLVLGALIPLAGVLVHPDLDLDFRRMVAPDDNQVRVAAEVLKTTTGLEGSLFPILMLVQGQPGQKDIDVIKELCEIGKDIEQKTKGTPFEVQKNHIQGLAFDSEGKCMSRLIGRVPGGIGTLKKFSKEFQIAWDKTTTTQESNDYDKKKKTFSAILTIKPHFNIMGEPAQATGFIEQMHLVAKNATRRGLKFEFGGEATLVADSMHILYTEGPHIFLIGTGLMMLLVALTLQTAFMPLKMVFTIILPLAATFGLVNLVFASHGMGILAWTGWSTFTNTTGMPFFLPFAIVGMLMGLGMDYELFLFFRVLEFREEGWTNQAAALKAVSATSPTITSSAIIMALIFGAQLVSRVPNETVLGFAFVTSVLFDAFVVRTVLEPCTLSVMPQVNYWPRQLPEPTMGTEKLYASWEKVKKLNDEESGAH